MDFRYTYRERPGASGQGMNVDNLQETVTDKDNRLTLNCYDDLNRVGRVETGSVSVPPAAWGLHRHYARRLLDRLVLLRL